MEQILASAPTILMVEDDPYIRLAGTDLLLDAGFKVMEAANADEALRLLNIHCDIKIVFTDVEMPGALDGFGLARCVHERWPWIGVLITSGRCKPSGQSAEADEWFVAKPYAPQALMRQIEACLSACTAAA